ncbi:RNA-directed DNA polymerase, eukaryota, reverse transcriptase zinc-binding domain protein [Tanacetum coccineum]
MNFRTLFTLRGNKVDVVVPMESIRAISAQFANTVYGLFMGKHVAYPVVANYVRNTWGKYGLVKSMLNSSTGTLLPSKPDVNLVKEDVGNVSVWVKLHGVCVTAFSEDDFSAIATKLGTPLMLDSYTSDICIQSWGRSSHARAMIEVRVDVELKDTIMVAMPKLTGEGFYTCNVRVEYEWKPPRCACCKVFGHVLDECPNNLDSDVVKNIKKPCQTPRGVPVGLKVGFKPVKQVYQHVARKKNVNTNSNKKKYAEPTIEVSNSNPFDFLNSIENDVDLGSSGGSPNLNSRKANTSGLLPKDVESSSTSNTPMVEKIDEIERIIIEGKGILVDNDGKPLKNVYYSGDHDSEDEVASTDNDIANFWLQRRMAMDILDKIQDICDNFDITVRGRKKK